jgi:hypothetical protein
MLPNLVADKKFRLPFKEVLFLCQLAKTWSYMAVFGIISD